MASSDRGKEKLSPRSVRARLEEELGKLDITNEEATPLIIDDREEEAKQKWMVAGKVLYRNVFHIQTISSALRSALGNPRGLVFRSVGKNMLVAEFATQHDRDRVWEGSPWHVSKNAVILSEFEDCMQPSELKFDRLQLWARIINLPFNLREKKWWLPISQQIDKKAKDVQFDHVGGYLRARVTVEIVNPLRRWILIDSARRKSVDVYEIQYEHIPHFCFSCGRLGHSDLLCPTQGFRDSNEDLPFGKGLRAPEEGRRTNYSEGSTGESSFNLQNKAGTRSSSNREEDGIETTSPLKKQNFNKRKAGTTTQVYRKVQAPTLLLTEHAEIQENGSSLVKVNDIPVDSDQGGSVGVEPDPKKKRPTLTSSENTAVAAGQPCLNQ
ncbi:hypothetical protein ACQ4PT_071956 [Festuca glaucescens]